MCCVTCAGVACFSRLPHWFAHWLFCNAITLGKLVIQASEAQISRVIEGA